LTYVVGGTQTVDSSDDEVSGSAFNVLELPADLLKEPDQSFGVLK
jgi:hypothetical protein